MAADTTPTEVSVYDLPGNVVYGSGAGKKRVLVNMRITNGAVGSSVNMATYVSGMTDVECILGNTCANKDVSGTALTWSTTTITLASAVGAHEISLIGVM